MSTGLDLSTTVQRNTFQYSHNMGQKIAAFQNKGMVRDLSVSKTGKDLAFENYNIRITAREKDTLLSVTNEKGNMEAQLTKTVLKTVTLTCHANGGWELSEPLKTGLSVIFESTEGDTETILIPADSTRGSNFMSSGTPSDIYIEPSDSFNFHVVFHDNDGGIHEFQTDCPSEGTLAGVLLGYAVLNSYLVLFTHDDSGDYPDHIYRVKVSTEGPWECLELFTGNLGFSTDYPIETLPLYELEDVQKVYWVDGLNSPRVINIMKTDYAGTGSSIFDFTPMAAQILESQVTITRNYNVLGMFTPGVLQYIFMYYNRNLQLTAPVYVSPQYYISYEGRGAEADETVPCSFTGVVTGLDMSWDVLRIIAVTRNSLNGTPVGHLLGDFSIIGETSGGSVTFTDSGNYLADIDYTQYLGNARSDIVAGTLSHKDNTLFLGDINDRSTSSDTSLREKCLALIDRGEDNQQSLSTVVSYSLTEDYDSSVPYPQPTEQYPYLNQLRWPENRITSYKGGEKYRFAVQFISDRGRRSQAFWIGDKTNLVYPRVNWDSNRNWFIQRPLPEAILPKDIIEDAKSLGYSYVQLLRARADYADRGILAQGILNPVVFNMNERISNAPFSKSSWFFRPKNSLMMNTMYSSVNASAGMDKTTILPSFDEMQMITDEASPLFTGDRTEIRNGYLHYWPFIANWRTDGFADMSRAGVGGVFRGVRYGSQQEITHIFWAFISNGQYYVWRTNASGESGYTYYWSTSDVFNESQKLNKTAHASVIAGFEQMEGWYSAMSNNTSTPDQTGLTCPFGRTIGISPSLDNVQAFFNHCTAENRMSIDPKNRSAWRTYEGHVLAYWKNFTLGFNINDDWFKLAEWGNWSLNIGAINGIRPTNSNGNSIEDLMKGFENNGATVHYGEWLYMLAVGNTGGDITNATGMGYAVGEISNTALNRFSVNNSAGFFVDSTQCTFHTPESSMISDIDFSNQNLFILGVAPISAVTTNYDIYIGSSNDLATSQKVSWDTNVMNTEEKIQLFNNVLYGKSDYAQNSDKQENTVGMVTSPELYNNALYPVIYPWHKSGRLFESDTYPEINHHILANRRYSYSSYFLTGRFSDSGILWRPVKTVLQGFRWIPENDESLYSIPVLGINRTYQGSFKSSYLPSYNLDVDSQNRTLGTYPLLYMNDEYIAGRDIMDMRTIGLSVDSNAAFKTSQLVSVEYKSSTHGILTVGNDLELGGYVNILPVLFNTDLEQIPDGQYPWTFSAVTVNYQKAYFGTAKMNYDSLRESALSTFDNFTLYFDGRVNVPSQYIDSKYGIYGVFFGDKGGEKVYDGVYFLDKSVASNLDASNPYYFLQSYHISPSTSFEGSTPFLNDPVKGVLVKIDTSNGGTTAFSRVQSAEVVYTDNSGAPVVTDDTVSITFKCEAKSKSIYRVLSQHQWRGSSYDIFTFYEATVGDNSTIRISKLISGRNFSVSYNWNPKDYTFNIDISYEPYVGMGKQCIVICICGIPVLALTNPSTSSVSKFYENWNNVVFFSSTSGFIRCTAAEKEGRYANLQSAYEESWFTYDEAEDTYKPSSNRFIQNTLEDYSNVSKLPSRESLGNEYMLIGEIMSDIPDSNDPRYGGTTESAVSSNTFVPAGPVTLLPDTVPDEGITVKGDRGDTFIQRYDCVKTEPYSDTSVNQIVEVGSFLLETHINLDGRTDRNIGTQSISTYRISNTNQINPVYSNTEGVLTAAYLPSTFDNYIYPNGVTWTGTKTLGEEIDSWTILNMANFLMLDGDKGKVSKLSRLNNSLVAFQDRGIAEILYNTRTQMATVEGVPIELANSGKVDGKRYITDKAGCLNKWSIVETKSAIYFIDNVTSSISQFNGSAVLSLSDLKGFKEWIGTRNVMDIWTPSKWGNFRCFWDRMNDDVYIVGGDTCLVYNEQLQQFTSFMDYYRTPMMVNVDNRFLTFHEDSSDRNRLWLQSEGDYNSFFGELKPYYIDYRIVPDPYGDKIFTNLEYRADIIESDGTLTGDTFNKIVVSDEYQSNSVSLTYDAYTPSDLKRKFRIWRANIPRSRQGSDNPYGLNRMRNPWIRVRLQKDSNLDNNEIMEFHDLLVRYYE